MFVKKSIVGVMEISQSIYYYLHVGGDLLRGDDGNMEYKGGHRDGMTIGKGMTYDEYVARVCAKIHINPERATFAYTLPLDPLALQPLRSDEDFTNMISFSEWFARVYITTSLEADVVEGVGVKLG